MGKQVVCNSRFCVTQWLFLAYYLTFNMVSIVSDLGMYDTLVFTSHRYAQTGTGPCVTISAQWTPWGSGALVGLYILGTVRRSRCHFALAAAPPHRRCFTVFVQSASHVEFPEGSVTRGRLRTVW